MYAQTAAGVHVRTLANVQACTLQLRHCTDWALACSSAIISGAFFSTSAISNVVLSILAKACSRWVGGWVKQVGGPSCSGSREGLLQACHKLRDAAHAAPPTPGPMRVLRYQQRCAGIAMHDQD